MSDAEISPLLRVKHSKPNGGGLPWWLRDKEFASQCKRHGFCSLAREDPTRRGAAKPGARAAEPSPGARVPKERNRSNQTPRPRDQRAGTAHRDERKPERQWRPSAAKHQPINKVQKKPKRALGSASHPESPRELGSVSAAPFHSRSSQPLCSVLWELSWSAQLFLGSAHLGEAPGPLFSLCPVSKLCSWVSEDPAEDGAHHLPP